MLCLFVIFSAEFCDVGNLRTMHWFPPGRVFQPGQQYEWKREPHTLGLIEKRTKKHTTYYCQHTSVHHWTNTHTSAHFWGAQNLLGLCFQKKQTLIWKHCKVMDWGILRLGRREMQEAFSSVFCFPSMLISKLGKTGCAESSSLSKICPAALISGTDPAGSRLWSLVADSKLWPCLTDVTLITAHGLLVWP